MDISILHLIDGAREAKGLTVIIDVFRAFSLECYLYAQGAELIIPIGNIDQALALKKANPEFILIGEREEKKIEGFDFGNSPWQIQNINFSKKTIIHTTSAGTQGIVQAKNATEIVAGSFVNAEAIIKYIRTMNPEFVSLVCMGYSARTLTEEDSFCAQYISDRLNNRNSDFPAMIEVIRQTSGKRFFDPEKKEYCPSEDFNLCLQLNRFNFIIKAVRQPDGLIFNQKMEIKFQE
jgi:2-phosphosulfolactate phosphatase